MPPLNTSETARGPDTASASTANGPRSELKAVSRWFRDLSREKRESIRALHQIQPSYNTVAFLFIALWVIEILLMRHFPYWPVWIICYGLIGFHMHGLANLMHEAVHGNFFRNRRLDRWFGFLLSAPVFVSASAFRIVHLQHHRYNRTQNDPDEISGAVSHPDLRKLAFYGWLVIGMFYYVLVRLPIKAWQLGKPVERRQMLTEYALLLLTYTGIFAAAAHLEATWDVLHAWIFPAIFTGIFANLRGSAEHMLTISGHPLTQSRTITSTRVFSFLNANLNYHLEHHLFPGIPWYNLPKVHALLRDEYQKYGSFVHSSYLQFLAKAVRVGVNGVVQGKSS